MDQLTRRPLVSIIVPSFNQGRFIAETIDSILSQDYRPIEVLVMDGASTDDTLEVLESYRGVPELKFLSEPDKGVCDAVNKGLVRASGKIIGIQSSDDLYLPGAISSAVDFMSKRADVALVYGDVELIDERSQAIGKDCPTPFDIKQFLGRFTYIPQPTAFLRSYVLQDVEGWRQEVSYVADADFWVRIAVRYRVAKLDRLMGRYRYHSEQRDSQRAKISRDWQQMVADLLGSEEIDKPTERFAKMGVHLAKYRYSPESEWFKRSLHLYRAAIANPREVLNASFPKRELIIGREPIWRILSKVKRRMGFAPRDSQKKWGTL